MRSCFECGRLDKLRSSDDGSVVLCLPCLVVAVDVATDERTGLFRDVPTVCIHGTPIDAPWCLACRLMAVEG